MIDDAGLQLDQACSKRKQRVDVTFGIVLHGHASRALLQSVIDALGVGPVALVMRDEGLDELGIHQLDRVPEGGELAGPVLGTAARFHADFARRNVREVLEQPVSLDLLIRDDAGLGIAAVDLKYALRNVDANDGLKVSRIRHEGLLLNVVQEHFGT